MAKTKTSTPPSNRDSAAINWLISGIALSTLAIWTTVNDPFNAPKSWVLLITATWLLGWLVFNIKVFSQIKTLKTTSILVGIFLTTLTASFIATDNKYVGLFGEYQRKTGYITYFCFAVFFLASAFLFRLDNLRKFEFTALTTGFLVGIYGFLQHFKIDFAKFVNPFNPVISTLGNPDFAAAIMAILLIISVGVLIQNQYSVLIRSISALISILLFLDILFSQVRQGLLMSILGVTIIFIIWVSQKHKKIAYALSALTSLSLVFALFGMLNSGPLVKYFYKASVTFRGDYFRAGWRMFISHPFFGVGLDRYGAYFRQYRDIKQANRRGSDLISNAAHNIPLQLGATGGIFLLVAYLALTLFIFWRGVVALRNTNEAQQILVGSVFAAWIAYEAQSLISIDNIGIAIWGYVLGGIVVGISVSSTNTVSRAYSEISQRTSSNLLVVLSVVFSILLFKAESADYQLQSSALNASNISSPEAIKLLKKPLSFVMQEPAFQSVIAQKYGDNGKFQEAKKILSGQISHDPRNYTALSISARINEVEKDWNSAIKFRSQVRKIDPFNTRNLLEMARDMKNSGDIAGAKVLVSEIIKINSAGQEAIQAKKEILN